MGRRDGNDRGSDQVDRTGKGGMQQYSDNARIASGRNVSYGGKTDRERPQTVAGGKTDLQQSVKSLAQRSIHRGSGLAVRSDKYKTVSYVPGDYASYRRSLTGYAASMKGKKPSVATVNKVTVQPVANVVRNVVSERPSPTRSSTRSVTQPNKAVNARTGNTTGINTGRTTGTTARVGGLGVKTQQSAYGRQMANSLNRTNQPAGPMGRASGGGRGYGGGRDGGGGGRGGGSLSGQGNGGRQAGSSRTGGTRGNEPAGPKRG